MIRVSDPEPHGLATMAAELGGDLQVAKVKRLVGGAMAVHLIELTDGVSTRTVVLKQFPPGVGSPNNEWDALRFAKSAGLPSPDPILYDNGSWFSGPVIVMSALPGTPCFNPKSAENWTADLVDVLAMIHATPVNSVPASMRRPGIWDRWDGSGLELGPKTEAISAAFTELRARSWVTSFCHCDFHPGNVLFHNGFIAGVVDWHSAKLSPFLNDVGRLRAAVAIHPGGDAPDLVATAYAERTGRSLEGLAYWDILAGALTLPNATAWHHIDRVLEGPLDAADVATRAATFMEAALIRIGWK